MPRLFIGSSSTPQSEAVVEVITDLLKASVGLDLEVEPWRPAFKKSGTTNIETLLRMAERLDFALMVFGDDDLVSVGAECDDATAQRRGAHEVTWQKAPRDNVIYELGLFSGLIGRERCMFVYNKDANLKLPSDLDGISGVLYERTANGGLRAALEPAVATIRLRLENTDLPPKRPQFSEIKDWEKARAFSRSIEGCWWSKRTWDDDTIGFITIKLEGSTPRVLGSVYAWDGTRVAQWSSDAASVLADEGTLHFHFIGDHFPARLLRARQNSEEYRGFSSYKFMPPDPPLNKPTIGHGELADVAVSRRFFRYRLLVKLERVEEKGEDIEKLTKGTDRARIAEILQPELLATGYRTRLRRFFKRLTHDKGV